VSTTVTVPEVALPGTVLITAMSHSAVEPCVNVPMGVVLTPRNGDGTTTIESVFEFVDATPAPLAVTELLTLPLAVADTLTLIVRSG
jgi:hypothetical protein